MAGLAGNTVRQPGPSAPADFDEQTIDLTQPGAPQADSIVVELDDGTVTVDLGGAKARQTTDLKDTKFDANLADEVSEHELGVLANELLLGIEEDERSRQDWLSQRAEGIKLLALQIEKPSASAAGSAAGVDNTSRTRSTMLLEAALRFQANARGELLPSDGPVKVEAKLSQDTVEGDDLAQLLEDDMNYYLLNTASEYVPDTDRMLLWAAVGGCGFKKVYRCPLRRRPVSESVDAADLIVSNHATDTLNADRVTFRVQMRQSIMKRMQHLKVYRKVSLGVPSAPQQTEVDKEKAVVTGIAVSMRPEDAPYDILECYCQIDVPGDEHKENGEITGLPRPYKVTLERTTQQVLEIRRNWKQNDKMERAREMFVKFPYVPGFGFYELGLIHIMGNPTVAATAILRIMIDAGIFGNFPGGLCAKGTDKQNTTDINVAPGSFAPIDVSMVPDGDIRKTVMPLPYKSPDAALFQLLDAIQTSGARVGGSADVAVGEGRQDAPVGTTLALIEQALKIVDAVHKRMHTAQAKEFQLLRDLFKENPEDFWKFNEDRDPQWDAAKLLKALGDYDLVPRADPNTSSQMQRILRWQAIYQMARADPQSFNIETVYKAVLRVLGERNPEGVLSPNIGQPAAVPPDPAAQAKMIQAQADQQNAQTKAGDLQLRAQNLGTENKNRDADRAADLAVHQMELRKEVVMHKGDQAADARSQLSAQQHEKTLAHAKIQGDMLGQAAEHAHAEKVAAMAPPSPASGIKP